jgi:hypothetical protein
MNAISTLAHVLAVCVPQTSVARMVDASSVVRIAKQPQP